MHLVDPKFFIDRRSTRQDGSHPVKYQIIVNRKKATGATGVYLLSEHWDDLTGQPIRSASVNDKKLLNEVYNDLVETHRRLLNKGKVVDGKLIKEAYERERNPKALSLLEVMREFMEHFKKTRRPAERTYQRREVTYHHLERHTGDITVPLDRRSG